MLLVALGLAGFLILLFRVPPGSWDVLWAEDGRIFLRDAYSGDLSVILTPYAGYLHIVPRLIAEFVSLLPIGAAAMAVTMITAALTAALAVGVYVCAEHRIASVPIRIAVWLSFVALPLAGSELANALCNLHWYLIAAAFMTLAVVARSRGVFVAQCAVVVCAVLCDPLALILTPVIILRFVLLRERTLPILFAVAGVLQLSFTLLAPLLSSPRELSPIHPNVADLLDVYAARVTVPAVFGVQLSIFMARELPWAIAGFTFAAIAAAVIAAAIHDRRRRFAVLGLAAGSLGFTGAVYWIQWATLGGLGGFDFAGGTRYNAVPAWLILWAALVAADALAHATWRHRRTGLALGAIALVIVAVPSVVDYHFSDVRAGIADWTSIVHDARERCATDPGGEVELGVAPSYFVGVRMSCDTLVAHA